MPVWILTTITIVSVVLILGGVLSFPYVLMFFGVYGQARQEPREKLIVTLLWLAPLFAVSCLVVAWLFRESISYIALLPLAYIILLWNIRANKQDTSGPQKRFADKQQNQDEQNIEQEYKWESWSAQNSPKIYLSFEFWAPNLLQATKIREEVAKNPQLSKPVKLTNESNDSISIYVYFDLEKVDRTLINKYITAMLNLAWLYESELVSTEVESVLPS